MQLIIDRFEGEYAVCEKRDSKEFLNLERNLFPSHAKEGDLVEYSDGKIQILDNTALVKRIQDRMKRLWK